MEKVKHIFLLLLEKHEDSSDDETEEGEVEDDHASDTEVSGCVDRIYERTESARPQQPWKKPGRMYYIGLRRVCLVGEGRKRDTKIAVG